MDEEKRANVESYLKSTPEDAKERFLLDYIKNMRWKDDADDFDDDDNGQMEDKPKEDLEEDIKDIDQQDRYEYLFNTRFEQDTLVTYPRQIEGSMRRPKDKRRQEREAKKRYPFLIFEDERKRREEELRRLRALKRQEIENKLQEIQEIGGIDKKLMNKINLDEDWDPDKYDAEMASVFNDDYYGEDEEDPDVKPDIRLDDILDEDELPEEVKKEMEEESEESGEDEQEEQEEQEEEDNNNKDKEEEDEENDENETAEDSEEIKKRREEAEKLIDELYNLDYEDMIGDTPVRFHYTKVRPTSYGLTTTDILQADDSDLRRYVSMKKLAPYRDHDWRVSKEKIGKFKAMLRSRLREEKEEEKKSRKQEKKQRKKEKKERERKQKEREEAASEKKRRRSKKSKKSEK